MRILYIVRLRGPEVIRLRGATHTYQAGPSKVRAICAGLVARGHDVFILSDGLVNNLTFRWFPAMQEDWPVAPGRSVPIHYGETWDASALGLIVSAVAKLKWLPRVFRRKPFDAAIVYNCDLGSVIAALYCRFIRRIPVLLEYEDTATFSPARRRPWWRKLLRISAWLVRKTVCGVVSSSPELASESGLANRQVLPGVINEDLLAAAVKRPGHSLPGEPLKCVYAGGLGPGKGIKLLFDALDKVSCRLDVHVCGIGPGNDEEIRRLCKQCKHPAKFHGLLSREQLVELLASADVGISPHLTAGLEGTVWPFKIVEYLAACGVVICSRTGQMNSELEKRLHIYEGDAPEALAATLDHLVDRWADERRNARARMVWAAGQWNPQRAAGVIERMLQQAGR